MAQCLNTMPFYKPAHVFNEIDAVRLYSTATTLDDSPGSYPPDDTGSSGLAVAQAAKQFAYINSYRHAFGLNHALGALMLSPMIVGTNWYSDMFNPDSYGFVRPTGSLEGGHEYLLLAVNTTGRTLAFANSWSSSWGKSGFFYMTYASFTTLLNQDGDVTVPSL